MPQLDLIICDILAPEAAQALAVENLSEVRVVPFAGSCRPGTLGREELCRTTLPKDGRRLFLLGPCGDPGLVECLREEAGNRVHSVEACTHLFLGRELAHHCTADGTTLLLPGQLTDRSIVQEMLTASRNTRRLVLLDTRFDPVLPARLQDLAAQVKLPAEIVPVGVEVLGHILARTVLASRLEEERARSTTALSEAIRRSSDHAMALDLLGDLARTATEPEAIESILDLFTMLFAPGRRLYVPWINGRPGTPRSRPQALAEQEQAPERLADFPDDYAATRSGAGFVLRIGHQDETLAFLEIDEVALPQHLEHYRNLALILAPVCGLTIANARSNERRLEAEEKIRHQAYHDPLTGLPNRLLFYDRLEVALAHAGRSRQNLGVMFVDLDHFKEVNDSLGHDAGDMLLQQVAQRLQQTVRAADSVARLGGDEFLLLLPDVGQVENAMRVAERVRAALEAPFQCAGHPVRISASIGLALYPDDGQEVETLIKKADLAMYRAKVRGGDRCAVYRERVPPTAPSPSSSP